MKNKIVILIIFLSLQMFAQKNKKNMDNNLSVATFGNGCFWCTEAIFQQLKGVDKVMPGYTGGSVKNPSYEAVCTGVTGHAEAIQITFDSSVISYRELLDVFFYTHDPTTLNRQGADVGTQYRSAIFYHDNSQKKDAELMIAQLEKEGVYDDKIVTEITPFEVYFDAEDYHKNYYNNNKNQGYCRAVINPKLDKFVKKYSAKIK
ncbi:Peptide-methionine (S)-S-oxide reductase MsrA [hydrothermal vent metagenome]|uniref:peptide-methionine (S)-S-oxide reductase n=1 Tax=hydrothermal vent metagenome TaxID=652676 RepID=A0A3B0QRK2_9ZZZZ